MSYDRTAIDQKRKWLKDYYCSYSWDAKVDKMRDAQIAAVYDSVYSRSKTKHAR